MSARIFIDGEAGTTGLQIAERLSARRDVELLQLGDAKRKDPAARRAALNACDVAILCLPDDAAIASVAMIENPAVRVIDASTAHRCADGWTYGFPELDARQRERLRDATRIANPGCYAIGAIALLAPLVNAGVLPRDWPVTIHGLSGYSGGGKALIAAFEHAPGAVPVTSTVYDYALGLAHKHVPEITHWSGLAHAPVFLPAVGNYYKGMLVHVPLPLWAMPGRPTARDVHAALASHYADEAFVEVCALDVGEHVATLDPESVNDTNVLRVHVLHNEAQGHAIVVAMLDNLGKGASGQAVQTLNVVLGVDERTGLVSAH